MQDILDMTVPIVVETSGRTERAYDIFSRLLKDRIVLLGSEVNDAVASLICAQLLFLESQDPEKEIYLYINSPGGSVTSGLAIYDTMQYISYLTPFNSEGLKVVLDEMTAEAGFDTRLEAFCEVVLQERNGYE